MVSGALHLWRVRKHPARDVPYVARNVPCTFEGHQRSLKGLAITDNVAEGRGQPVGTASGTHRSERMMRTGPA